MLTEPSDNKNTTINPYTIEFFFENIQNWKSCTWLLYMIKYPNNINKDDFNKP
jgi:hypothetical protein